MRLVRYRELLFAAPHIDEADVARLENRVPKIKVMVAAVRRALRDMRRG